MPDMTPVNIQKKGSATSGFQRIAEVALQDLVVFRIGFTLVRVPCDTTIYEVFHISKSECHLSAKEYYTTLPIILSVA